MAVKSKYSVIVVGMGKRGIHHAVHFHENPFFKVVGICDLDKSVLAEQARQLGNPKTGTDARTMAMDLRPDVFCFCTRPDIRSEMVAIGVECGARMIAFEKPLALTTEEGFRIRHLLDGKNIKTVVCHQHRYAKHYRAVKEVISSGAIGPVHTVYGYAQGWAAQLLSHLIDYSMWFNKYAKPVWVIAQAAGKSKLSDPSRHESPDYIAGFVQFANGVRGIYECGGGAPDVPNVERWWHKNRMGATGPHGFAEVYTGNGWTAVTRNGFRSGEGKIDYASDMPGYIQDMAVWLDDDGQIHPCCFANAYAGFEIMMGLFQSAALGGQVSLPLARGMNEIEALRKSMPDEKLLPTLEESKKEYS